MMIDRNEKGETIMNLKKGIGVLLAGTPWGGNYPGRLQPEGYERGYSQRQRRLYRRRDEGSLAGDRTLHGKLF